MEEKKESPFCVGGNLFKSSEVHCEPGHMRQYYHHCDQGKGISAWVQAGAPLTSHGLTVGAVWAQNEIKVLCEEQISYLLIYSFI